MRAVCREVNSGRELLALKRAELISSNGWALTERQSSAVGRHIPFKGTE